MYTYGMHTYGMHTYGVYTYCIRIFSTNFFDSFNEEFLKQIFRNFFNKFLTIASFRIGVPSILFLEKILCFDSCNQTWHGSSQQYKLSQKKKAYWKLVGQAHNCIAVEEFLSLLS